MPTSSVQTRMQTEAGLANQNRSSGNRDCGADAGIQLPKLTRKNVEYPGEESQISPVSPGMEEAYEAEKAMEGVASITALMSGLVVTVAKKADPSAEHATTVTNAEGSEPVSEQARAEAEAWGREAFAAREEEKRKAWKDFEAEVGVRPEVNPWEFTPKGTPSLVNAAFVTERTKDYLKEQLAEACRLAIQERNLGLNEAPWNQRRRTEEVQPHRTPMDWEKEPLDKPYSEATLAWLKHNQKLKDPKHRWGVRYWADISLRELLANWSMADTGWNDSPMRVKEMGQHIRELRASGISSPDKVPLSSLEPQAYVRVHKAVCEPYQAARDPMCPWLTVDDRDREMVRFDMIAAEANRRKAYNAKQQVRAQLPRTLPSPEEALVTVTHLPAEKPSRWKGPLPRPSPSMEVEFYLQDMQFGFDGSLLRPGTMVLKLGYGRREQWMNRNTVNPKETKYSRAARANARKLYEGSSHAITDHSTHGDWIRNYKDRPTEQIRHFTGVSTSGHVRCLMKDTRETYMVTELINAEKGYVAIRVRHMQRIIRNRNNLAARTKYREGRIFRIRTEEQNEIIARAFKAAKNNQLYSDKWPWDRWIDEHRSGPTEVQKRT